MLNRFAIVPVRQQGLSIVELMVALAISSFLILGVTQLYINNKKTYLFQQGQELNQENGRFALALLNQELAKAGYRRRPDIAVTRDFPADSGTTSNGNALGCNFAAGAAVAGDATSLCIRYQARDVRETDCRGQVLGTQSTALANNADAPYEYSNTAQNAVIVERFSLAADGNVATGAATERPGALVCASNLLACGNAACTRINGDTSTAQLIGGIRDLRFDYGVGADRSVTAFSLAPAASAATLIRTVRYAALMQSTAQGTRDSSDTPAVLSQWNGRYSTTFTGNAYLYQIAQDTITLRNLMP
ncbi:MAG: PilW family protein [Pseudomonas oryzihabitans]